MERRFKNKSIVIFTLVVIFAFSSVAVCLEDNWRHWDWGLKALNEKDYNRAMNEFNYYIRNAHIHRHMFGVAYFGRALVAEAMGNSVLSIDEYKMSINNDNHPTVKIASKAYMNIGTIYMRNKDYTEAIKVYLQALEIKPNNGLAHYYLGLAYFHSGEYEKAEKKSVEARKLGITYDALSNKLKKLKRSPSNKKE